MNTKERIVETALRLFNETGTSAISTNHIAEGMSISPGNLYYHFRNKKEIIRAILDRLVARHKGIYQLPEERPPTVVDLQRMVRQNFLLLWDYRFFYRELIALLQRDAVLKERYLAMRREGLAHFEVLFECFVDVDVIRMPADSTSIADLARICWLISDYWLPFVELESELTMPQYMQQGIRLVLQALRPYLSEEAQAELFSETASLSEML
jgi:AcrR family transcriptional regulator